MYCSQLFSRVFFSDILTTSIIAVNAGKVNTDNGCPTWSRFMLITWLRDQCSRGCQGLVSFNCSLLGYNILAKNVSKSKQTACWCHFIFTNIFLFPGSAIDFFCYLKEDVHEFFHWWKNNFLSSRMLLCPFPPSGWLFQSQIYLKKTILKVHSELKNFGKKCNCFCLRLKSTVF